MILAGFSSRPARIGKFNAPEMSTGGGNKCCGGRSSVSPSGVEGARVRGRPNHAQTRSRWSSAKQGVTFIFVRAVFRKSCKNSDKSKENWRIDRISLAGVWCLEASSFSEETFQRLVQVQRLQVEGIAARNHQNAFAQEIRGDGKLNLGFAARGRHRLALLDDGE